jgi:hypothetical protein
MTIVWYDMGIPWYGMVIAVVWYEWYGIILLWYGMIPFLWYAIISPL